MNRADIELRPKELESHHTVGGIAILAGSNSTSDIWNARMFLTRDQAVKLVDDMLRSLKGDVNDYSTKSDTATFNAIVKVQS